VAKYVTTQQYEPLRAPSNWNSEEKKLVQQLTDRLDDLYGRFNRLRVEDLSQKAKDAIFAKIVADRLDVDEIMGGIAFIDRIKSKHIASNSVDVQHINPLAAELIAENTTGQQLVVTFTNGTILDKSNISTTATAKIYDNGEDITDSVPAAAFHWERVSENTTADATWNAAHVGVKSVTIASADVDFKCAFRCTVDEIVMRVSVAYVDGVITITDGAQDVASDFTYDPTTGEIEYTGSGNYEFVDGCLIAKNSTSKLSVEITASNLKTSFISIFREGIEIYGSGYLKFATDGELSLLAGSIFNLRAGSGENAIGMSNNETDGYMQWAGAEAPAAAPFSVKRDGTVKATTLELGNSQITDVTNTYPIYFVENADASYPAVFQIYIPENTGSVASIKMSFKATKYRADSKGNVVSSTVAQTNNTTVESLGTPHNHTQPSHGHSSSISYGIYEKATLPTSCALTVDGTAVATYTNTPPSVSELEISSYLSKTDGIIDKGWHEIQISTNDDARIVANVFVQTVVSSVEGTM
jgi:hypothetical protein